MELSAYAHINMLSHWGEKKTKEKNESTEEALFPVI
jgi:hypothetical protein